MYNNEIISINNQLIYKYVLCTATIQMFGD